MLEGAHIGLKVDVDTLRGTREGVPRLAALLRRHGADATFYFSVGPDHTGRAMRRVFRKGFARKVARTSVLKHYGLKTLLYGVLLPGPDIGARAAAEMRAIEMDLRDSLVRLFARGADIGAQRGDTQHPAPGGDDVAVLDRGGVAGG